MILEENINIDELLVVTFTNAAASEMRARILDAIYEYLDEHPELDREIEKSATIYADSHDNLIIDAKLRMVCCARII